MQESLETSLVRIRTADGRVVGAGFLVGERHILTCAHVISKALDLSDSPLDSPQALVSLDFPLIPPRTLLTASIVQWCPPLPDGRGDIAGLELQGDPPAAAAVVRFAPAEDVWEHAFLAFGFPAGYDDGVWATGRLLGRQATDWVMIEDVKTQGFAVPGFSGTPVWDTQVQGVVGMVVAASRPTESKTAFVIPLDVLAAAWPLLTVPQGKPRNPYKGLRPFTQQDANDFFGRKAEVEQLAELVRSLVTEQPASSNTRLLTILGPSGAGKSSLVMAGLLPQLQRGMLPGSDAWLYLDPMVPGKHPLESLVLTLAAQLPDKSFSSIREDLEDEAARGLHQLCTHLLHIQRREQPGARVILLVDQWEELFTQTESKDERQRFIQLLLTACSEPRGPLLGLLTLRADFYDRPMQYPDLFRLIDTQHLSLLSIEPDNLRQMVEQPAALSDVQVTFEGDLVNRLLADVQGQVGALPLLQFTLDQLFQRRSGRQLTLSAYREIGGVKGALARQAEETYAARQNVFISYSHKDEKYLKGFLPYLKYYEQNKLIDYWADTKIKPGENWQKEIEKALASAKVAVLLISIDFLVSQFIVENELPPLLAAAEAEGLTILPVVLRPCTLPKSLSQFQAINSPSSPLVKMKGYEREELWVKLANSIMDALNSQKSGGAPFSNPPNVLSKATEGIRNAAENITPITSVASELAAERKSGRGTPRHCAVAGDRLVWALWTQDGGAALCHQRKAFARLYLSTGASTGRGGHDLPEHDGPPGGCSGGAGLP